jgi:hypothetical protein
MGGKKTTLSLLPAPKSRSARILPHKRWHGGEMTKGNSSSHLRRSCHALMGSYPIIAAILTLGNSSAGLLNKNWKKPHPTPLLGKEKTATTLHTHTLFPPLSCQSPTIVLCSTSAIAAREFCFLPRQQTSSQVSEAAK